MLNWKNRPRAYDIEVTVTRFFFISSVLFFSSSRFSFQTAQSQFMTKRRKQLFVFKRKTKFKPIYDSYGQLNNCFRPFSQCLVTEVGRYVSYVGILYNIYCTSCRFFIGMWLYDINNINVHFFSTKNLNKHFHVDENRQ